MKSRGSRHVLLISLLLLLPVGFASCGDDDGKDPGASRTTTVRNGGLSGTIEVQASGGDSELAVLSEMAESFEEANSGTTVELVGITDQGEHIAKLATAFAGNSPPDAFLINHRRVGRFIDGGAVEPAQLGNLPVGALYEPPINAFTFDAKLMCLPQNVSSVVTYVNPAVFAKAGVALPKAGWTWPDALGTARALAAAGVQAVGFTAEMRTVAPFVWSAGGEVVDSTEAPTRVTVNTPAGRKALRFLLDLQATGLDATERAAAEPADQFAAGNVAMFFDSRRAVPGFRKAGTDFDVVPLPRDVEPASLLASDGWCVSKKSDHKALARAFAHYAVGGDGARQLAEAGRTVPVRRSIAQSPAFLDPSKPPKGSQVFLDVIEHLHQLPSVANWNDAEEQASDTIEQLFAGKTSLDAAVSEIERDTAAELAKS